MKIEQANKTLEYHGRVEITNLEVPDFDLLLMSSDVAGGPGEDVRLFIKFQSVCYTSLPSILGINIIT
jgi:hypothetical protein